MFSKSHGVRWANDQLLLVLSICALIMIDIISKFEQCQILKLKPVCTILVRMNDNAYVSFHIRVLYINFLFWKPTVKLALCRNRIKLKKYIYEMSWVVCTTANSHTPPKRVKPGRAALQPIVMLPVWRKRYKGHLWLILDNTLQSYWT